MDESIETIWEDSVYLRDRSILHIVAKEETDDATADMAMELAEEVRKKVDGKLKILIDLNSAKKQSPHARDVWRKLNDHETTGKVAMFGVHPVARVLASFVIGITKKKNHRFFKTEQEALLWLRE